MTSLNSTVLITGATGQVGSAVVRELERDQTINLRTASRSAEKASLLSVPWTHLDYDNVNTIAPALEGVDTVFMVTGYSVDMLWQSKAFINEAKRSGVKHIVHLGAPGDDDTNVAHWGWHQFVERYIEWTGLSYTHLRPEIFMNNLLGYGGTKPIDNGVIRHYVGTVPQSWVAADDIASVAAAVLKNPSAHAGQTYRLGYDTKTYDEIAQMLTTVIGQPFRYEARPPAEFIAKVLAAGGDKAYFECAYRNYSAYTNGISPGSTYAFNNFTEITGKQPAKWSDFIEKNKERFRY